MEKMKLDIDKVTPGMKLAEAVTNAGGITLMPAGIRLTPMFINRLKKWNVTVLEVLVERSQAPAPAEPRRASSVTGAVLTAEQEAFARGVAVEVSKCFVDVREDPLMVQLRNAAIKKLIAHGPDGVINRIRRAAATEGP